MPFSVLVDRLPMLGDQPGAQVGGGDGGVAGRLKLKADV